jgi:RNA polymerase sigma factor (sigma-70 family)
VDLTTYTMTMEGVAPLRSELIERARTGDKDAFDAILRLSLPGALRLACALLGNAQDAEDVVQEAAIKGWRKLGNLRTRSDFEPWFLGIVVREVRSMQRGRWWSLIRMPEVPPAVGDIEGNWLAGEELRRAVSRLPRGQKEAVLLHFYLDLTIEASAETLRVTPAAVKSRLNRALRQLRTEIR